MEQRSDAPNPTVPLVASDNTLASQNPMAGVNSMSAIPPTSLAADGHVDPLEQPSNLMALNTSESGGPQSITAGMLNGCILLRSTEDSYSR